MANLEKLFPYCDCGCEQCYLGNHCNDCLEWLDHLHDFYWDGEDDA